MLPFGAWAAFTAAALVLLFHGGSLLAAAGVFGFGATVILIGDNFIQPALVGGTTRLPFLLALIGIFGGLQTFGLIGLFLGPGTDPPKTRPCREESPCRRAFASSCPPAQPGTSWRR